MVGVLHLLVLRGGAVNVFACLVSNRFFLFFLPKQIIDLLEDLLNHHSATTSSRSSVLTALAKVSYRLGGGLGEDGRARVEGMLEAYRSSITLELQQRWVSSRGGIFVVPLYFHT